MHRNLLATSLALGLLAPLWIGLVLTATSPAAAAQEGPVQGSAPRDGVDHLSESMALIGRAAQYQSDEADRQIRYHLDEVIRKEPIPTWQACKLLGTLDDSVRPLLKQAWMDQASLAAEDVDYLRECYLFQRVARWAMESPGSSSMLREWFQSRPESIDEGDWQSLQRAARLFDWTITNVQLEPAIVDKSSIEAKRHPFIEIPFASKPDDLRLPPSLQMNGTGYRRMAMESLYFGSGDAWQRAAVMILLCRQAGIDAYLLAVPESTAADTSYQVWCVGVHVGREIYLFDTQMGIPINGPGQSGIATLTQAKADPSVLRRMNVAGGFDYPIQSKAISRVTALLECKPSAITQRIARLQSSLVGDWKMIVSIDPDAIAERAIEAKGITEARIWSTPLQAIQYRMALREFRQRNMLAEANYQLRLGLLLPGRPLAVARWSHLIGRFDVPEDARPPGARISYMEVRKSDKEIEQLHADLELQVSIGLRRELGEDEAMFMQRVAIARDMLKEARQTACFWLGCIELDLGHYDKAVSWFDRRTLKPDPTGTWSAGARFNLAQCYEQLSRKDEATALLKTNDDPQEHGNRLRARFVNREKATDAAAEPAAEPAADAQ
jgi:tetratricopeptide (TPR) repeat protein